MRGPRPPPWPSLERAPSWTLLLLASGALLQAASPDGKKWSRPKSPASAHYVAAQVGQRQQPPWRRHQHGQTQSFKSLMDGASYY